MSKRTRLLSKLKHVYSHNTKLVLDVSNDDIGLIIEGVEKQIRKKPFQPFGTHSFKCSNCFGIIAQEVSDNCDLESEMAEWCPYCGQKLDWSETDEKK